MDKNLAETLVILMEGMGENAELRTDYSGRSMYGKTTYGIVVDNLSLLLTCVIVNSHELIDEEGYSLFEDIENIRYDSMAMQIIVY